MQPFKASIRKTLPDSLGNKAGWAERSGHRAVPLAVSDRNHV